MTPVLDAMARIPIASVDASGDTSSLSACGACATSDALGFRFSDACQPIVDARTRTIHAHEALVRGEAGEPAHAILSRISDENRYRFDPACRVKAIKIASSLGIQQRLSINSLPNAIYKPELCIRTTLEAARTHRFPIERILFEATEGDAIEDGRRLAAILTEYERTGLLTAIDDFGAGYAGVNLLADFQPDIIKLDLALVRGGYTSRSRQAIARGVLRICADLDIVVVTEGVETAGERDFFFAEGVSLMQGDFFCRPILQGIGAIAGEAWPGTA